MSEAFASEVVSSTMMDVNSGKGKLASLLSRFWGELVILSLVAILWAPRLSGPIDLRWDAGVYYVLGTSLAEGHGYRILSEPGAPEAIQYPPLLPAFVAVHERLLGSTEAAVVAPWLRISYAILFLFYGLAILALARRYLRVGFAIVAVALSLLQVNTLFMSDLLFAELPFALVSVLFALVGLNERLGLRPWMREILSFVLAATGFLLRTAGLALFAAWILESIVRRRWRLAIGRSLMALLPVIGWQAHVMRVRASYEYAHPAYEYQRAPYQFYNVSYAENVAPAESGKAGLSESRAGRVPKRLALNVCRMGKRLGEGISTSQGYWQELFSETQGRLLGGQVISLHIVLAPILGLSALVTIGVALFIRRRAWLMALIIISSIGLICLTPWPSQFQRYLMPLTPFLAIATLLAFVEIRNRLRKANFSKLVNRLGHSAIAGLVVLAIVLQIYTAARIFYARQAEATTVLPRRGALGSHLFYLDALWCGWHESVTWIEQHSPPDAIVATPYSHLCYLQIGHRAVSPPVESDPGKARRLLDSVPVSYVIVDRGYTLPAVEKESVDWSLVRSFNGTRLYQRQRHLR
jgi:hypothetical protein